KYGLYYEDAISLFQLKPNPEVIKKTLQGDAMPMVEWLETVSLSNSNSEDIRIRAACLANSFIRISFTEFEANDRKQIENENHMEPEDDCEFMYEGPIDKEKHAKFLKEKDRIESYTEDELISLIDDHVTTKCLSEWDKGKKLHRGRILNEIDDLLHVYNFLWELSDEARRRLTEAFEIVWKDVERKREDYESRHLDEWFDKYTDWTIKHNLKKSTKSNIAEFFKSFTEVKMKTTTIEAIKDRYNSK
ncbi:MAG: hypothetical protein K2H15_00460, partial [Muribaculaceae bacterium]|nr:hypothetical protein [Muribaculaceae bacterium]